MTKGAYPGNRKLFPFSKSDWKCLTSNGLYSLDNLLVLLRMFFNDPWLPHL
jgi:hypothetical protein